MSRNDCIIVYSVYLDWITMLYLRTPAYRDNDWHVTADERGRHGQQGEHEEQAAGGEAGHRGHHHVRRLLAPHPARPPAQGPRHVQGHHRQHLAPGNAQTLELSKGFREISLRTPGTVFSVTF